MAFATLYFVRHGETDMNREFRCQGRVDTPLNETGLQQAAEAARELSYIKIDHLYSSPLRRALDCAVAIGKPHGLEPQEIDWLTEIDHGRLEGMNREEAEQHYPGLMDKWIDFPHTVDFPGGESLEIVKNRVIAGLRDVCRRDAGAVVFVTHQVVTGVARCHLFKRPLSEIWKKKLLNGKFLKIEMTPDMMRQLDA